MPRQPCYFEDLAVGRRYAGGTASVDVAGIKAFAAAFDPQPFHLDEAAARASIFGRLVASGWHTMALTMRMLVDGELRSLWGLVGLGADELRWPRPVVPGDVLSVEWEVLDVRRLNVQTRSRHRAAPGHDPEPAWRGRPHPYHHDPASPPSGRLKARQVNAAAAG